MRRVVIALSLLLVSSAAWAGRRPHHRPHHPVHVSTAPATYAPVSVGPFSVRIRLGPWAIGWSPAPRAGYAWVSGYLRHGHWIPGYWRPLAPAPRPDVVFVAGHWEGDTYVDGYWRDEYQEGLAWQDGYYDEYGDWVDGRWVPPDEAYVPVLYVEDLSDDEEWVDSPASSGDPGGARGGPLAIPAGQDGGGAVHAPPPVN